MNRIYTDFKDYLRYMHACSYTELDDDISVSCEKWVKDLGVREVMVYAELYGNYKFDEGLDKATVIFKK